MFYDRFVEICRQRDISPSQVAIQCGFNKSSVTNWKKNGYAPRQEILIKIADYFDVSVDYLLGDAKVQAHNKNAITDTDIKFALFGGNENITDEMLDEVKTFAQFVKNKYKDKKE